MANEGRLQMLVESNTAKRGQSHCRCCAAKAGAVSDALAAALAVLLTHLRDDAPGVAAARRALGEYRRGKAV